MKLAVYIKTESLHANREWLDLVDSLSSCELYDVASKEDLAPDTDMLLSVGGDGTFLSAARIVAGTGIPVLGVNLGRLGFLSENKPADVAEYLLRKEYVVEDRTLLKVSLDGGEPQYALNEVSAFRGGAVMMGVDVCLNGEELPTYWADGLLVATSSGSTAYSLSVGGPICAPDARVLIISPIASHNLNVRPLVVPCESKISLSFRSREETVVLAVDNSSRTVDKAAKVDISMAQFSLKRVRLGKSNFIGALRSKLLWGEDVRNDV